MSIGWYPGHMHKARKDITQTLHQVDAILEVVDARLPHASENPLLNSLIGDKPRIRILNKADLADPDITSAWLNWFSAKDISSLELQKDDKPALAKVVQELQSRIGFKVARANRIMIVGIPNVGKSTLINLLAGRKLAKTGNEPAVTKARQEISLDENLILYDTPGILWPKLEDQQAALRLAASGAIRNTALDLSEIGFFAAAFLQQRYPEQLHQRYQLTDPADMETLQVLENIGKRRGCLVRGGVDLHKVSELLLNDLRSGKLGRISLETPADIPHES